jgi:uncharacterized membrane protein
MPIDLAPIMAAPLPIKLHLATVLPAFAIGTYLIFVSAKGAPHHRALGYLYLTLMTITAGTTLFIHEVAPSRFMGLSFVHLFIPLTIYGVVAAIVGARTRNVPLHRNSMIALYLGGFFVAGGTAFGPGRMLHQVFFP